MNIHRNSITISIFTHQNIIRRRPVAEVEDSRKGATVVRFVPGGKGQTGGAHGEGVDAHVLVTGSREKQLVVGDRGAVHKSGVIDNRTAGNVPHPGSRHRVEAVVQLQAIGQSR